MLDKEDREIYRKDKADRKEEGKDIIETAKDIKDDIIEGAKETIKEVREDYHGVKKDVHEEIRAEDKAEKEFLEDTE